MKKHIGAQFEGSAGVVGNYKFYGCYQLLNDESKAVAMVDYQDFDVVRDGVVPSISSDEYASFLAWADKEQIKFIQEAVKMTSAYNHSPLKNKLTDS